MEMTKKEFLVQDDSVVLKEFVKTNSEQLGALVKDSKTAQVSLQPAHIKLTLQLLYTNISCWGLVFFFHAFYFFFQEAYVAVVEYFGENPKTTQPSMFFPLFGRFIRAYKVKMCSGLYQFLVWH